MYRPAVRSTLEAAVTMTLAMASSNAGASAFGLLEQSASRLGTAFAGTAAAADDATTVFFNPAGMVHLGAAEAVLAASAIEIDSEFNDAGSAAAFGQPLGNDGGDAGDWNFVPAAYFATPIGEDFAVGVGVNAPFGLKLVYEGGWIGRFQALRSEIKTLNVNPSIAYRFNERFSLGVGLSYQRLDAELTNSVNYSAVVAQGVQRLVAAGQLPAAAAPATIAANAGLEGPARVRGDDDAWGFNAGLLFDLSERTRLGVSYRSAIEYEVSGTVAFGAPPVTNPIGTAIVAAAAAPGAPLSSGAVVVDLEVPDSALLSLQQQIGDRFALLADVAWTGWSTVQELRIVRDSGSTVTVTPQRWEDVWRYALGVTYAANDRFTLRAGAAYDETPVPTVTRTPRLPDSDRIWIAVGGRWQPSAQVSIDVGYAHLFGDEVPLDQDADNPAASALLSGEQHSNVDIVSVQAVYRF